MEYWDNYIRVLHGHYNVPNARQFRTSGHDGTHSGTTAESYDKGEKNLALVAGFKGF